MKAVLVAILLCGFGAGGFWVWRQWGGGSGIRIMGAPKPVPDAEKYAVLVGEASRWREILQGEYRRARTVEQKAAVEHNARVILETLLPEMMRCWLGTPYDFNGTAERPGAGKVACGYFVSTILRDAGFRLDRYKLAQQPSENILRTFLPGDACKLRVGESYPKYADWVDGLDSGVYLIGMDTHVGFIVVGQDGLRFLHSSGANGIGVVEETRNNAWTLRNSNWRMLGNLTGDPGVQRMWLAGENVKVRAQ